MIIKTTTSDRDVRTSVTFLTTNGWSFSPGIPKWTGYISSCGTLTMVKRELSLFAMELAEIRWDILIDVAV